MTSDKTKKAVLLKGLEKLTMFTVWSWLLQGAYFTLSCYCSLHASGVLILPPLSVFLQRVTWVLFEISFPVAFLVSLVVTYVLLPGCKNDKLPVALFFQPVALVMHNANVWFMAFEFIVNQLPFVLLHIVFMLIYGLAYAIFSWFWFWSRGFYYYFFLDFNRNGAIWWYIGLVVGLSTLFLAGYGCSHLQDNHESHILPNSIFLIFTFLSTKLIDS